MRGLSAVRAFASGHVQGYRRIHSGCSPRMVQQAVNYGPTASEELKPKPNPGAKQLNPEGARPEGQQPKHAEGETPKTIGDALEEAAQKAAGKPLEVKDTRAIQSAEARATGAPSGVLGGPAAYASNLLNNQPGATLGDALHDAKDYLPADKVATQRDAYRVTQAEARNDPRGQVDPQGVAASLQEAADYNKEKGFVPDAQATTGVSSAGRARGVTSSSSAP